MYSPAMDFKVVSDGDMQAYAVRFCHRIVAEARRTQLGLGILALAGAFLGGAAAAAVYLGAMSGGAWNLVALCLAMVGFASACAAIQLLWQGRYRLPAARILLEQERRKARLMLWHAQVSERDQRLLSEALDMEPEDA